MLQHIHIFAFQRKKRYKNIIFCNFSFSCVIISLCCSTSILLICLKINLMGEKNCDKSIKITFWVLKPAGNAVISRAIRKNAARKGGK